MHYCPFCRREFEADETHCPDCQVRLVDEAPKSAGPYQVVEEVPVARYPSLLEAEMSADILRQAERARYHSSECVFGDEGRVARRRRPIQRLVAPLRRTLRLGPMQEGAGVPEHGR